MQTAFTPVSGYWEECSSSTAVLLLREQPHHGH
jgi:hypothetical protein